MSRLAEQVLLQHLVFQPSVSYIAQSNFDESVMPTDALRPVYRWAMGYYHDSQRTKAPSVSALLLEFSDVLKDYEIDMESEPEDSVEWAVETLAGDYIRLHFEEFNRKQARIMAESLTSERMQVLSDATAELAGIMVKFTVRKSATQMVQGVEDRISAYYARDEVGPVDGLHLGLPEVDEHMASVQPGELAVIGGSAKSGKSYMLAWIMLNEWKRGRHPILYTLENSVAMTLDRIVCMGASVDSSKWQRNLCTPDEIERVHAFRDEVKEYLRDPWVVFPSPDQRKIDSLVRGGQMRGADSILIDQLTFVDWPSPRSSKTERIGEALHLLKLLITEREGIACVMVHQLSREGEKEAEKTGKTKIWHFADSVEVERTVDMAFALYQSVDDRVAQRVKLQLLAMRREALKNWELLWSPQRGLIKVLRETD